MQHSAIRIFGIGLATQLSTDNSVACFTDITFVTGTPFPVPFTIRICRTGRGSDPSYYGRFYAGGRPGNVSARAAVITFVTLTAARIIRQVIIFVSDMLVAVWYL